MARKTEMKKSKEGEREERRKEEKEHLSKQVGGMKGEKGRK